MKADSLSPFPDFLLLEHELTENKKDRRFYYDTIGRMCRDGAHMALWRQHLFVFKRSDLPGAQTDLIRQWIFSLPGL